MPIQFACPKCGQRATLTTSKPGDWIECPGCDATVQIPGPAPVAKSEPAPVPSRRRGPAPEPLDFDEDEPRSPWADKRVQIAAIGGGLALLLCGLLAVVLLVQRPKKEPEVVQNEPPAARPAPPAPKVEPPVPKVEPKADPLPPKVEPKANPLPPKVGPPKKAPDYLALDQFGNPIDQNTGLAQRDEFKGQRLLFWAGASWFDEKPYLSPENPFWKALEDKGFVIRREFGAFKSEWLKEADQLWIASVNGSPLTKPDCDAIVEFVEAGKGLCLLADNDPLVREANELANRLCGASVRGNYRAMKIAYVRNRNLTADEIRTYKGEYSVDDHPLLAGVNFVWEGDSVSHVGQSGKVEVALTASDGKALVAVSKVPGHRVIIDCGFTRYYSTLITKTAGTTRLAQNIAAYLAGKTAPK